MMIMRFVIGLDYAIPLLMDQIPRNHKSATYFPSTVDSYLSVELDRGAVIGLFMSSPFLHPILVLPFNSVLKANTSEWQMILDLNWPTGSLINDAIPDRIY